MKQFLLQFFTWWNGQTLGTRFWTWRAGEPVGTDEFGNSYYRTKTGDRRWVIYNGEAEASRIPAAWHGWMHKRTDIPPPEDTYKPRVCHTRPPTEPAQTTAFVEVDEITLANKIQRLFTGWMFAASPGLHAIEHPVYDVWLIDCKLQMGAPPDGQAPAAVEPEPDAQL